MSEFIEILRLIGRNWNPVADMTVRFEKSPVYSRGALFHDSERARLYEMVNLSPPSIREVVIEPSPTPHKTAGKPRTEFVEISHFVLKNI